MSGQAERICQQIMSAANSYNSVPNRSTEPYYVYGEKDFGTFEGNPPQIRINPIGGSIGRKEKNAEYNSISGSLGTRQQDLQISVWGHNEDEVWQEVAYFIKGIEYIRTISNAEEIAQLPVLEVNYEDADTSAKNSFGKMISFNYSVRLNINDPIPASSFALVTTASVQLSGSSIENPSSYQGTRTYNFITSSI